MGSQSQGIEGDAAAAAFAGFRRDWYKRAFDLSFLFAAHIVLFPVFVALWTIIPLAIWLEDRGSVFYSQRRAGKGGRMFLLLKFRTMRQNQREGEPTILATEDDPRITLVGRIIRPMALDELPQVLNVFAGQMSFVGPRPEPADMQEELVGLTSYAQRRLWVRPGLTGLAQLYGGYHARLRDKLRFDLLYIQKMNPWLDLRLILFSFWRTLCVRW